MLTEAMQIPPIAASSHSAESSTFHIGGDSPIHIAHAPHGYSNKRAQVEAKETTAPI